jgi:hypothetical protein
MQNCRPYYRDRVFSSMNAIALDIGTEFERTPFHGVKLLNPAVVQSLGLKEIPFNHSTVEAHDSDSEVSTDSSFSTSSGARPYRIPSSPNDPEADNGASEEVTRGRQLYQVTF